MGSCPAQKNSCAAAFSSLSCSSWLEKRGRDGVDGGFGGLERDADVEVDDGRVERLNHGGNSGRHETTASKNRLNNPICNTTLPLFNPIILQNKLVQTSIPSNRIATLYNPILATNFQTLFSIFTF